VKIKAVANAGGLVVRNGSTNFVKLPDEFEAFDYAHSSIKSPFMDVWLNANCAFWIGNMNGASVVPIAFGKVRLITDAW
jgi:putative glycosyltransferase (TIGR04372 family)